VSFIIILVSVILILRARSEEDVSCLWRWLRVVRRLNISGLIDASSIIRIEAMIENWNGGPALSYAVLGYVAATSGFIFIHLVESS